jgi:hypothetical protein
LAKREKDVPDSFRFHDDVLVEQSGQSQKKKKTISWLEHPNHVQMITSLESLLEEDEDEDNVYARLIHDDDDGYRQRGDAKEGELSFTPTHTPQSSSDSEPRTPPLKELIDELVQCNAQAVQAPECIDEDYSILRGTPLLSGRVKQKIAAMVEEFVDAFLTQLGMCVLQATGRQEARLAGINTKVHRAKLTLATFDAQRRLDEERRERCIAAAFLEKSLQQLLSHQTWVQAELHKSIDGVEKNMLLLKAHMRSNQASRQAQRKRDEIQLEYIRSSCDDILLDILLLGTHFTCFMGTKVQILKQNAHASASFFFYATREREEHELRHSAIRGVSRSWGGGHHSLAHSASASAATS